MLISDSVLPDVTIEGEYTLRMKDDFGLFFETSIFSLRCELLNQLGTYLALYFNAFAATLTAAVDSATTPDEVQVPLSIPASESSNVTDISPSATVASTADPTTVRFAESSDNASLNPSATASSNTHSSSTTLHPTTSLESDALRTSTSSPVTTTCTSRAVNTSSPSATPQDLATRRMPSTAAFAIPLSAIGAILILAAGLAFQHRRKLGEERTNDAEKLDLSRQSSIHTHESAGQVQYALDVLSRHDIGYGAAPAPVPLFMPVERDSARWDYRWPTKVAFVPASSVAQTSVKSFKAVRAPKSRPLLTRLGLSSRSDAHTPPGTNNAAKWNEDPATYSIIADYVTPSPPLPPSLLTAPERAYVRNEAPGLPTSSRTNGSDHKPLSSNPSS